MPLGLEGPGTWSRCLEFSFFSGLPLEVFRILVFCEFALLVFFEFSFAIQVLFKFKAKFLIICPCDPV